jgi:catechol 2,3-dioxygenase-like lactoylglutathione lyase family enzyme
MRLTNAMIFVHDFPAMTAFYRQVLGTKPVNTEWHDRWALFQTGGADFALHAIPSDAARDTGLPSPIQARETSPVKLTFTVEDVRAVRAQLEGMGVTVIQRPWQQADEAFDGVDPEGNIFQVTRSG